MGKCRRALAMTKVFLRYGLTPPLTGNSKHRSLRWATRLNPFKLNVTDKARGDVLCDMLEELGPIFVKFGQQMSVHPDLFPADIIAGLTRLQDDVKPFASELAVKNIEDTLGGSVDELFSSFDEKPLASASIAQVHTAVLLSGESVVIKLLRPGIEAQIKQDIALMYVAARWVKRWCSFGKRLKPVELVKEFEETILGELDLKKEAASASQLRRNFEKSTIMYVPKVYWPYTHSNMMVMERVYGVRVSDVDVLKESNTNLKALAEYGVEIFFTQVLRDSFFHADMHPGNLFIDISNPQSPRYIGVDFGIMGSLSDNDQYYLAKNLAAFFSQDYREVARLHLACGWVPRDVRVDQFEAAIRSVCEPIFQRPLKEISFAEVLLGLLKTARQFKMEMQPQLLLLQKTLVNIEGLGRRLYPDLDLWKTAKPIIDQWLRARYGSCRSIKRFMGDLPQWVDQVRALPELSRILLEEKVANVKQPPKRFRGWFGFSLGLLAGFAITQAPVTITYKLSAACVAALVALCIGKRS